MNNINTTNTIAENIMEEVIENHVVDSHEQIELTEKSSHDRNHHDEEHSTHIQNDFNSPNHHDTTSESLEPGLLPLATLKDQVIGMKIKLI